MLTKKSVSTSITNHWQRDTLVYTFVCTITIHLIITVYSMCEYSTFQRLQDDFLNNIQTKNQISILVTLYHKSDYV